MPYPVNFYFGWGWILAGFVSGAGVGLFFHRPGFLGGYDAFPRRLVRLGHICFAALGMLNVLFALSPVPRHAPGTIASACFVAGAVLMPAACFLTAWRENFRRIFFLPVATLMAAVVFTLIGASS